MNTKLHIEFHSAVNANLITDLAVLVGRHNEGNIVTNLPILESYFKDYCDRFRLQKAVSFLDAEAKTLTLCIQPEQPFITISEHLIIGEVSEYMADVINQNNLS